MKIVVEYYGHKYTVETEEDTNAIELANIFYKLGLLMDFHQNSLVEGFREVVDEQE